MKSEKQQAAAAKKFAEKWQDRGYEKGDTQSFWIELLTEVYGVDDASTFIRFEEQVKVGSTKFIDASIDATKTLIEQKSLGKDLRKGIPQSDGSILTPFQQAKRYAAELSYSARPRWIVTCNFAEFLVYDMERPHGEPEQILLKDLEKEYYRLQFLVDVKSEHLTREMEVSMAAGEIVGKLYDELLGQYIDPTNPDTLKSLNVLCVRLVFCLYAEDAGIFGRRDMFHDFLAAYSIEEMRNALIRLFKVLDTPIAERDPYMREDLLAFPYANGGLFADEHIEIPRMTDRIRQLLLQNASLDFDWSQISPTIFGAVFESTLNPETRRSGGMHYTSIENIHKVIDPLFMNDLRAEFETILEDKVERNRNRKLEAFQDKLASLKFLDPACGSGNFLTETYLSLRRLENEVIRERYQGRAFIGFEETNPIKVSIDQFYGIEINDFAVTVATTALWISEAQMLAETERIIHHDIEFLPLKKYSNIREGNALRMDWDVIDVPDDTPTIYAKDAYATIIKPNPDDVILASEPVVTYEKINLQTSHLEIGPKKEVRRVRIRYDYIIGNPPFVGHQWRSKEQAEDMDVVFNDLKKHGKLDYVTCWYKKAADMMLGTDTQSAFVSTNSIIQGEPVAALWQYLFEKKNVKIQFAYQSFVWSSEATKKAAVHCVIIGFTCGKEKPHKTLFTDGTSMTVEHINGYLIAAPDVYIQSRGKPLLKTMPFMSKGSQPTDGGNLILSSEERDGLLAKYPECESFVRRYIGADEFINNKMRYCLWLKGVSPSAYRHVTPIMERLNRVAEMRAKSPTDSVRRDSQTPMLFTQIRQPQTTYLVVPEVSSERRRYVPIGYMEPDVISSNMVYIIPDVSVFMFGVMTSNVHMAWMRAVCGRLKSDYRYTPAVYNNFPWPEVNEEQQARIERTAQAILDARALYPESSLADLYDEVTMPPELRRAHQNNDRAVMAAYGFDVKTMTESQCVAELFKLYQQLAQ